jgi:tetratricopeptide (TPR) repeat protein
MYKKFFIVCGFLLVVPIFLYAQQSQGSSDVNVFLKKKSAGLAYNKGIDNVRAGKFQDALTNFTEAINANPSFDMAYLQRGKVKFQLSDNKGSLEDINKVL